MAENAIFDMELLLQSTCDDKELAAQVVGVFLSDIPVQFDAFDAALASGDRKTVERVVHTLKGASATVGGEAFRDAAYACERAAHAGDLDEVRELAPALKSQYELLKKALHDAGFAAT